MSNNNKATTTTPPSPTFRVQRKDTGTLSVWSGALRGEFDVEQVSRAIPFRKHTKHGYTDRKIWQQEKDKESPEVVKRIGQRIQSYLGVAERRSNDTGSSESWSPPFGFHPNTSTTTNYANYYANGSSHTFLHRDYNCNPNELITLVCFGATRNLVFCSCTSSDDYIIIPMSDGTIVQFDGLYNTLHYHKVLRESAAAENNNNDGPSRRVSIQWYEPRDEEKKWDSYHLQLWQAHTPEQKHIVALKRRVKRDLEPPSKKLDVEMYIPKELRSGRGSVGKRPIPNRDREKHDSKIPKLVE